MWKYVLKKLLLAIPVLIGSHVGPTLLLMGVSSLLGFLIAIPAGIYSAA